jgi:hypothetical protein
LSRKVRVVGTDPKTAARTCWEQQASRRNLAHLDRDQTAVAALARAARKGLPRDIVGIDGSGEPGEADARDGRTPFPKLSGTAWMRMRTASMCAFSHNEIGLTGVVHRTYFAASGAIHRKERLKYIHAPLGEKAPAVQAPEAFRRDRKFAAWSEEVEANLAKEEVAAQRLADHNRPGGRTPRQ